MPVPKARENRAVQTLAEHKALRALVEDIERASTETRAAADEVKPRLDALREKLAVHFAAEERAGGLFDQVQQEAAEQAHECQVLRDQHSELLHRLDELLQADASARSRPEWAHDVRAILDELGRHEARENELLTQVLDGSIQAQD